MNSSGKSEIRKVRPKRGRGRTRKDGSPPRKRKPALPLKVRRGIKEMLGEGKTRAQIKLKYKRYNPTDSQINAIKYGRVKLTAEPRTDAHDSPVGAEQPVHTGKTVTELLKDNLLTNLEDMQTRSNILPGDRAFMLEKLARVDRHIKSSELESALGRRDSAVIAALVRMYEPSATDEDIVRIYKQAVEITKMDERDG